MLKIFFFTCAIVSLTACSRHHEKEGYIPLSSVPDQTNIHPSNTRLKALEKMEKEAKKDEESMNHVE